VRPRDMCLSWEQPGRRPRWSNWHQRRVTRLLATEARHRVADSRWPGPEVAGVHPLLLSVGLQTECWRGHHSIHAITSTRRPWPGPWPWPWPAAHRCSRGPPGRLGRIQVAAGHQPDAADRAARYRPAGLAAAAVHARHHHPDRTVADRGRLAPADSDPGPGWERDPEAAGELVVTTGCLTDATRSHQDESVTLATGCSPPAPPWSSAPAGRSTTTPQLC
jgi:hypothetical protein